MGEASPFSRLVVLETGGSLAAAFAGVLLADFGAQVFVCEEPPTGSPIRALGGAAVQRVWWKILARNKRSAALDSGPALSDAVLAKIVVAVDLILVDDRAGTGAERWRAAAAAASKPPLVVGIAPTGSDRPDLWRWSTHPALTAAATGVMAMTGQRDAAPRQPEFPLAEYLAGTLAAGHAVAALRQAHLAGQLPMPIRLAAHEALQRMIEWQLPIATAFGRPELRNGNSFPMAGGISKIHRTGDGHYVATSAATQRTAVRLMMMVGGEALRDDPRFVTPETRQRNMPALDVFIDRWMAERTRDEILRAAEQHDVVIGPIHTAADVMQDPHMAARGNVIRLADEDGTAIAMPNVVPRITGVDAEVRHLGPRLGADTGALLSLAGLDEAEIQALCAAKAAWC